MEESLLRRMGCEMVSNAALRSRRMRMSFATVVAVISHIFSGHITC